MVRPSLQPLSIGGTTLPNRIFRPAHQTLLCPGGRVSDRFIDYHLARAVGGAGLLILDGAPIHQTSAASSKLLSIWDDGAIEGLTRLRRAIGATATKVFVQLWHGGANTIPLDGGAPWSASPIAGFANGVVAEQMTQGMIDEIVEAYGLAAARAAEAGLEGIEIHAAHGYLPQQFLSAAINLRTDDYGGSPRNRARFLVEVMRSIRSRTPPGFCIGAKIGPELLPGLTSLDDIGLAMQLLKTEGLIDFVSLSTGSYITSEYVSAAMHEPAAYQIDLYRGMRERLGIPLFATGRYRVLDEADQVLRSGEADLIGMVRAMIADPDIVRKTSAGREQEIRPCIACNQRCVAGIAGAAGFGCAVNPAAGREARLADDRIGKSASPRRVLVVGGGVAGMEAARVSALRGHDVTLCEALPDLGGKLRLVGKKVPRMAAVGDIVQWQESELRRLSVEIRTSSYFQSEDLAELAVDAVVLAVGAADPPNRWQRHRPGHHIEGADLAHVRSSPETLSLNVAALGETAVVIDDIGHFEAGAMAEYLINLGLRVVLVTRLPSLLPLMEAALRTTPLYERLHRTGRFDVRTRAQVERIAVGEVTLFDPRFDPKPETLRADSVVLVTHPTPDVELVGEVAARGLPVMRIGDCLSPRFIEGAIADGYRAALQL